MATRCRSCGARISWALSAKNRSAIPLDVDPRTDGNLVVEQRGADLVARAVEPLTDRGVPRYVSHFATCPNASEHRKGKGVA